MEAESPTRRVGREVEDLSCLTIHQDMGRFRKEAITNLFFLAREEEFPDLIVTGNDITYQLYPESKSMDRYIASINSSHTFLDKLIDILLNILKSLSLVHSRNACLLDLDINHIFIIDDKLKLYFPQALDREEPQKKQIESSPTKIKDNYSQDIVNFGILIGTSLDPNFFQSASPANISTLSNYLIESSRSNNNIASFKKLIERLITLDQKYISLKYIQKRLNKLKLKLNLASNKNICIICTLPLEPTLANPMISFQNCSHSAHIKCFCAKIFEVCLDATDLQELLCPGAEEDHCVEDYGKKCKCKQGNCKCGNKKVCKCEFYPCICGGNICKYSDKKRCICESPRVCKCRRPCWCKPFGYKLFEDNKVNIPYTIMRKVKLLEFKQRKIIYKCPKSGHVQYYRMVNKECKPEMLKCICCGKGPCSFCHGDKCPAKKCPVYKKELEI